MATLEAEMLEAGFWNDPQRAQQKNLELSKLKRECSQIKSFKQAVEDLQALWELIQEDSEAEEEFSQELQKTLKTLETRLESLEVSAFLSEPYDACNALLSIHAGAGGTESCDWAEMLLRMYCRWAEQEGYSVEIQDIQSGDEAGIQTASLRIIGANAYGYAKAERGVHRLVRISPFDANKRRHTSFCAVDVIAEIEDDSTFELNEKELRIDTYRSSGSGGQHVNKTDSAVRITHLPTGIAVACQNERSQHKNKATAMKVLKSRLYEKTQDEKRSQMEQFYGEKGEIGWGRQIRSYVLQPYQMIKDLRTNIQSSNISAVMDGALNAFIHGWLRMGRPSKRIDAQE